MACSPASPAPGSRCDADARANDPLNTQDALRRDRVVLPVETPYRILAWSALQRDVSQVAECGGQRELPRAGASCRRDELDHRGSPAVFEVGQQVEAARQPDVIAQVFDDFGHAEVVMLADSARVVCNLADQDGVRPPVNGLLQLDAELHPEATLPVERKAHFADGGGIVKRGNDGGA